MKKLLVIFDERYSGDNTFLHSYLVKLAKDVEKKFTIESLICGKYQGPVIKPQFPFVHVRNLIPIKNFTNQYWASNVTAQDGRIIEYLSKQKKFDVIICFSWQPTFLLKILRWVHVFYRARLPRVILITPQTHTDSATIEDFTNLGGILLQDADLPEPRSNNHRLVDDANSKIPFHSSQPIFFHDPQASPFRFLNKSSRQIEWLKFLEMSDATPLPVRDVVLFIRPDWMKSGSATTFGQVSDYFRQRGSLLIDVAIFPYSVPFTEEDREKNICDEQRLMRSALYFSVRKRPSLSKYIKTAFNALKWLPTTISNQWLLMFSSAVMPHYMRLLISRSNPTIIYLNHYFTYLYAKSLIGSKRFVLDTHDIQAINRQHHQYINSITNRLDNFDKAVIQEFSIVKKAHRAIFVSASELKFAESFLPKDKICQVVMLPPVSRGTACKRSNSIKLLVVASAHPGNVRGVSWLLDTVWPLSRKKLPKDIDVQLDIVGSIDKLLDADQYKSYPEVTFRGIVENISDAYSGADVVLTPIISGGGLAIKTIEAVLHRKPIVSTTHAMRGLPFDTEAILPTADTPVAFSRDILDLIGSEAARNKRHDQVSKLADLISDEPFLDRLDRVIEETRLNG